MYQFYDINEVATKATKPQQKGIFERIKSHRSEDLPNFCEEGSRLFHQ
jgi:hypothetical protein